MAGTSLRKRTLLTIMLVALLQAHDDHPVYITYRSGTPLWQCSNCKRVGWFRKDVRPVCYGTAEDPHLAAKTRRVLLIERLQPSKDQPVFKPEASLNRGRAH
jgi:hypothetical protein